MIKNLCVYDTWIFGCLKNATTPIYFLSFFDILFFDDLPSIFACSKKVSKALESEQHFFKMLKFTPLKVSISFAFLNIDVDRQSPMLQKLMFSYYFQRFPSHYFSNHKHRSFSLTCRGVRQDVANKVWAVALATNRFVRQCILSNLVTPFESALSSFLLSFHVSQWYPMSVGAAGGKWLTMLRATSSRSRAYRPIEP